MNFVRRPSAAVVPAIAPITLILVACAGGCSHSSRQEVLTAEHSTLKPLSILYGRFQASNESRPPANEADFKKYIHSTGESTLKQFKTDVDHLFVSHRDGKPYVVFYGKQIPPSGVIAYEREGAGGERIVAFPYGSVGLVDEARFQELVPNAP